MIFAQLIAAFPGKSWRQRAETAERELTRCRARLASYDDVISATTAEIAKINAETAARRGRRDLNEPA